MRNYGYSGRRPRGYRGNNYKLLNELINEDEADGQRKTGEEVRQEGFVTTPAASQETNTQTAGGTDGQDTAAGGADRTQDTGGEEGTGQGVIDAGVGAEQNDNVDTGAGEHNDTDGGAADGNSGESDDTDGGEAGEGEPSGEASETASETDAADSAETNIRREDAGVDDEVGSVGSEVGLDNEGGENV